MTAPGVSADRIRLRRAYDPPVPEDGVRILVDRLWPRGVRKEAAAIDHWLKDIAPSSELRQWFGHDPVRWPDFHRRYLEELHGHAAGIAQLRDLARQGTITLVFGARDEEHNNAVVLRDILTGAGSGPSGPR
ncbi:MAG: DUF488 domain-containing protein [Acetobacteraceae bacterium]